MKNFYALIGAIIAGMGSFAQSGTVKGKITTMDGEPAPFVSVVLKDGKKATLTGEDGSFILSKVPSGTWQLVISHTGLETVKKQVFVKENDTLKLTLSLTETADQLDEVIVAGRKSLNQRTVSVGKIPIPLSDLPQSVTIIGQGLIRDQQALRLSDVVKNVNGVYLSSTRGAVQENFSARGYTFSSTNMFKNGARVNSGIMAEVSSLERVEVLKGSAAILYGNVAPGGILNMVTRQPRFESGGALSVQAGSYGLLKPAFDVYGPLSDKIAYRLNGTYETANSYRDVVYSRRYYINPSFLFQLNKKTELVVQGDYLNHRFTPDFGIGSIDNTKIAPLGRSTFLGAPWSNATSQQATASANLKHRFNDNWQLNVMADYQNYNRDYYSTERIQIAANGDWSRPLNRIKTQEDYSLLQADINGTFKTGKIEHHLLTGVDADRYLSNNHTFDQPRTYDKINIFDPAKYTPRTDIPVANDTMVVKMPTNRIGAYVQDLLKLSNKLNVLVGARWSYQEAKPADSLHLITGKTVKGNLKVDQAWSPRFGIVYKPTGAMSIFASYANSFTPNTGTDIYGQNLSPSIIDQFELGMKNELMKGMLTVNLTVYRIVNNNLAQMAPFLTDGSQNSNSSIKALTGQTKSDGVELDITGHPAKGLDLIAGYSYNYIRYTRTSNDVGSYVEGERLIGNPAHTANATVFYTFHHGRVKGLKLGASAFYTGNRYGGFNDIKGQAQSYTRIFKVGGYATADISASYGWRKFLFQAKLSNITNTLNYTVHENYSINPIPPRQIIGTVAYHF